MKKTILTYFAMSYMFLAQTWAEREVKIQVSATSDGQNIVSGTVFDDYSFAVALPDGNITLQGDIAARLILNDVLGISGEKTMQYSLGTTVYSDLDLSGRLKCSYGFGGSSVNVNVRKGTSAKNFTYNVAKSGSTITGTTDGTTAAGAWSLIVEDIENASNSNGVYAKLLAGTYVQVGDEQLYFDTAITLFDGDWNAGGLRAGLDKMMKLAKDNAHINFLGIDGQETFKGVVFLPAGSEIGAGNHKATLKEDCKVTLDLSEAYNKEQAGNIVTGIISGLTNEYDRNGKKALALKAAEIFDQIVYLADVAETVNVDVRLGLLPGDVNRDGEVNVSDVTAQVSIILGNADNSKYDTDAADVNGDGDINVSDVTALVSIILNQN